MKKLLYLLLAFSFVLVSCDKDEKGKTEVDSNELSTAIVGTWVYEKTDIKEFTTNYPALTTSLRTLLSTFLSGTLNIGEDFEIASYSTTYTADGDAIHKDKDGNTTSTDTYSLDGNVMTITSALGTQTPTISITGTKLTMNLDFKDLATSMLSDSQVRAALSMIPGGINIPNDFQITKLEVAQTSNKQ